MYEQICEILKQNNINFEHIFIFNPQDSTNREMLDDGQFPIVEYLIGEDPPNRCSYLWLLIENGTNQEERGYKVINQFRIGMAEVLVLEETLSKPHLKEEEEIEEKIEIKE